MEWIVERSSSWPEEFQTQRFKERCDPVDKIDKTEPLVRSTLWEIEDDPQHYRCDLMMATSDKVRTSNDFSVVIDGFRHLSSLIGVPLASIQYSRRLDPRTTRSTPYGVLPKAVIGADGRFYTFSNCYWLSENGKALKSEGVFPFQDAITRANPSVKLQDFLQLFGADSIEEIKKLDFVPRQEDGRLIPLSQSDYEMVHSLLVDIQRGRLKLRYADR